MRLNITVLVLTLSCALLAMRLLRKSVNAASARSDRLSYSAFDALDRVASGARRSTDPERIHEIVEQLAMGTGFTLSDDARRRIVRAEIAFRSGNLPDGPSLSQGFNDFVRSTRS